MPRLRLLRHFEAEPAARGGDDFERRLSARGREEAEGLAAALARRDAPQIVLASAAPRARESAELAAAGWDLAADVFEISRALYFADVDDWAERLAALQSERIAQVVGHNPALSLLAGRFLGRATALPPGGLLAFDFAGAWGEISRARLRLDFVLYPPRFEARAPKIGG